MNDPELTIPELFREKVLCCFKTNGEAWLEKLPDLLKEFINRWELTDLSVDEDLSVHFICYAHSKKYGDVVLKTGVPHLELYSGMDALLLYDGNHACKLYEMDRGQGIILLERIIPGTRLKDEPEFGQRIRIGAELAGKLPVAIHGKHDFPIFQKQLNKAFGRARCEELAPEEFISMLGIAEKLYDEIMALERPALLLHGDLHHENILKDASGKWQVIDPQGRIGERCLETGRFLLNEWEWFNGNGDLELMSECINTFAEALGESPRTITISCFLDYALSSCWTLEEDRKPEKISNAILQMKILLKLLE